MRLFVGIDIPDTIRAAMATYMNRLEQACPGTKWVRPESLHLTLKFIGESAKAEDIKQALAGVHGPRFNITFRGTGFFTPRSPRVFWVGVDAGPELKKLAQQVETALVPLGIEKEAREYSPHLTLAREGSGRPSGAPNDRNQPKMYTLKQRVGSDPALANIDFGTMQATEFTLYKSETQPEGAKYSKLARFPLT
ncbi:MAG TPA: RNA 2',3'-cyclic phosphodiesterase [Terriglobales bacterium]|nr:RNA 2',3'-cyclic phosphodiesterase [Terriglobales bacterium]